MSLGLSNEMMPLFVCSAEQYDAEKPFNSKLLAEHFPDGLCTAESVLDLDMMQEIHYRAIVSIVYN